MLQPRRRSRDWEKGVSGRRVCRVKRRCFHIRFRYRRYWMGVKDLILRNVSDSIEP